jgi:hypothetical protein
MRIASRIYEEVGLERRVEFDMNWNTEWDDGCRTGSPPGPWIRKDNHREMNEKGIKEKGKEKKDRKEKKDDGKERDDRMDSGREVRKGQPPPTSALRGYKYPIPKPKSILKQRTDSQYPNTSQRLHSPSLYQKNSGNKSQQSHSPSNSTPDFKPPLEIPLLKQTRQPMDRQKCTPLVTVVTSSRPSGRALGSNLECKKYPSKTNNNLR